MASVVGADFIERAMAAAMAERTRRAAEFAAQRETERARRVRAMWDALHELGLPGEEGEITFFEDCYGGGAEWPAVTVAGVKFRYCTDFSGDRPLPRLWWVAACPECGRETGLSYPVASLVELGERLLLEREQCRCWTELPAGVAP